MDTATTSPLYDEIPDLCHRFVDYVGGGFLIGTACGSALYSVRGLRGSPAGGRLAGAARAVRVNAPRAAGFLAAYSALFCASERAMALARRRDDPWNAIVAGAASLGLLHMRLGGRTAAVSALFGAAVSVVLEGADWVADEWDSRFVPRPPTRTHARPLAPATATTPIQTEPRGSGGVLSWLRSSTSSVPSPSITSKKDPEVLDLRRKTRQGFHSPGAVEYGFSSSLVVGIVLE